MWKLISGNDACNHYYKFREDIALMKAMGVKAYRFSLSWSRIIPAGFCSDDHCDLNPDGIQFYENIFEELKKNDIDAYVTLYHWDLPSPLRIFVFH
jgi:beta-glucosidase/6-phospho-beta-glucosidase/beta-galactosidase